MSNYPDTLTLLLWEQRKTNDLLRTLPTAIAVALATRRRGKVSPEDREVLDLLLGPLREAMGAAVFTLRDMDAQAELYRDLRTALAQLEARRFTKRKLGKLFARVAGADLGGVVLWCSDATQRDGCLWRLESI